jgi:hypothetical protein
VGIEVDGHGAAILIAEDGSAQAETKTCRVADGVGTDIGVKGAIRTQEAGPGVSDENLDYLALGGGFKARPAPGFRQPE